MELDDRIVPTVVDLTTAASSGSIGPALFQQGELYKGGSGALESFVRIRQTGTEYGYNTSARPYTDPVLLNGGTDNSLTFNHALPLSDVPLVAIGGQAYLDFSLDFNQNSSDPLLSLDEVQVSLGSSPTLQGYTTNGTYGGQASLIYDMNPGGGNSNWVKLNSKLNTGSSGSDMDMNIPLSALPDSAFTGANRTLPLRSDLYVYLYSHFGAQNLNPSDTNGSANGGYEEWVSPVLGTATATVGTTIYDAATTTPITGPVPAGVSVEDGATASGSSGTPTGSVTFLFYNTSNGTGNPIGAGTVLLDASGVANYSDIQGPLPVGAYSFVAHYNGDSHYLPSDSPVEPLDVVPPTPSVVTTQNPTTVTLGTATPPVLTDSATLSLAYIPTGTMTFKLYAPNGTTVVDTETVTVSGNGTYSTPTGYTLPGTGTVAGTYQWVASYSGDSNNNPASSTLGQEPVTVALASPTIGTTPNPSSVTLNGGASPTLMDSATIAGGFHPGGSVTFQLYAPNGTTVVDTETVTVTGNGTYTTPIGYTLPITGTVAGTYQWVATYSGDANNNSVTSTKGSEPVTVVLASPAISTSVNPLSVTLSGSGSPTLKDSATLSGGYAEGGTITFQLYAPNGSTVLATETVTVSGNGTYTTPTGYTLPATGTVTGTYQWVASYSGDANNNPVSSPKGTEPVTVSSAIPTISTSPTPSNVTLNGSGSPTLKDSATLAGGYHEGGNITFKLYAPNGTTVVDTETVTVNGDGTYTTPTGYTLPSTGTVVGTYQWVASYSGDGNNVGVDSKQGDEPVAVALAKPTISTTAIPTEVAINTSPFNDSAVLAGGYGPTGTITFQLYAQNGTTVLYTDHVTVNGNGTYSTATGDHPGGYIPQTTGTYQWVATYSGDTNNNTAASNKGDEPVIATASPSFLTTSPSPAHAALDGTGSPTLKDSATLTNGVNPTGSLTFKLYAPDGTTVVDTETVAVNGNGTYNTPNGYTLPIAGPVTGTYQWVATYSGDVNNGPASSTFGQEPVTIALATPAISTTPAPSNITLDSSGSPTLKDSATLTGGYNESGTLIFQLYAPDGSTLLDTETVTVSGNGTYNTPTGYTLHTTGGVTGTYQWVVTYSGDANNHSVDSPKGIEPVTVNLAAPSISTTASPSGATLGSNGSPTLKDSATLTGGYNDTGTITFRLYAPDGTTVVDTETAVVNGAGTYTTPNGYTLPTNATVTGTYQWVASYSGDANNNPVISNKGDEPVAIAPATPTISTTPNLSTVTLNGSGSPTLKDSATIAGGYHESGTITFRLYAPGGNTVVDTETVTVSGNGTYSTPIGYTLPTTGTVTGTYQWVATYSGDGNNTGVASTMGDEPVTVSLASPTIVTTPVPPSVTLGSAGAPTLKDSATIAGGYHESGTITFQLYAPDGTTLLDTETVTVNGNGTYNTPNGYTLPTNATVTGTYQWVASYSGDTNNNPIGTTQGDEPVTVALASPAITTTANPSSITLNDNGTPTLKDSATLTGGYNESGTITFQLYAPDGTTVVDTETVTVSGNGTYTTPTGYTLPTNSTVTGTYHWLATYSGDGNNVDIASIRSDEPVSVALATPAISTSPDPSNVTLTSAGSPTLKDSATLVGGYHETGSITFQLYAPDGTTLLDTETVTVNGNGTYTTPNGYTLPTTGTVTGTYQWLATYSGDGNNNSVTNKLGDEPVTVATAHPTIGTSTDPTQVAVGTNPFNDSAVFAGGYSPTGSITFQLYAPDGTTVVYTDQVTVNGNGTYSTASSGDNPGGYIPLTTGTYQWVATYSGDANNDPIASNKGDEPVIATASASFLTTSPSPSSTTLNGNGTPTLKDSATLTNGVSPTGTVTFKLYAPDGTTVVDTETVTVNGNGTYSTPTGYTLPTSGTVIGTYQWVASYSGDANNNPATSNKGDEPVTVVTASPAISTTASPADLTLSNIGTFLLKDSATLTGGYNETGTITFQLYAPDGTTVVDTETAVVSGNGTYSTPTGYTLPTTGTVAGTYQWVATYSGDGNNTRIVSVKGDEPVEVDLASPAIVTTTAPPSVTLNANGSPTLKDSATLSGGYHQTGDIIFKLYAPDGTTVVDTETVAVNGNGTYTTPIGYTLPTDSTVTGTYQWIASYSGDANNNPVASTLGQEPANVSPASPAISTTANPPNITLNNTGTFTLNDSATLSGGYNETGTITFRLYAPGVGTAVDTETVTVNGDGTYSTPTGYTLPTTGTVAGTYQWVVSYSGDGNNAGITSPTGAEPVTVALASPAITTTTNPADVALNGNGAPTLKDSATLSGGYNETGTITFRLYAPDGTTVVDTETVTVSGDGTYNTPNGYTLPTSGTVTGTYQWVATYSGDGNNTGISSIKGEEPVIVDPANLAISTAPAPSSLTLSGAASSPLKDSATLSGGYGETGSITFRLYAPDGTTVVDTETVTVSGNGTYTTPNGYTLPTTGTVTGTYQWVASYSGDGNNNPVTSNKGDEPVTVLLASPAISTTPAPANITLGSSAAATLKDSATITGGYHETGSITFRLYAPDGTTVVDSETVTVSGNGTYTTPNGYTLPTTGAVAGTYQWVASYSGDGNNNPVRSTQGQEPVGVRPASPTISTTPNPSSIMLESSGTSIAKDSATLAGGYHETGSITFRLYAPDGTTVVDTETVMVNGNGTYSTPNGYAFPTTAAAGTYQWVASYSGDANNNSVTSTQGQEPVTVESCPPVEVVSLRRIGIHHQPTRFVLTFNGALDPATASNPANYHLSALPPNGRGPGQPIAIIGAIYNPTNGTVTLIPVRNLYAYHLYRLTITGLNNTCGDPIDGNGDGKPGGIFTTTFGIQALHGITFHYGTTVPTPPHFRHPVHHAQTQAAPLPAHVHAAAVPAPSRFAHPLRHVQTHPTPMPVRVHAVRR